MATTLPATGRLAHLGRLTIHRQLLRARFAAGCGTSRCEAACCALGALVDAEERDRVLAQAGRVAGLMTTGQERDPRRWFASEEHPDPDFPSGRATHTRAGPGGCVFLDAERRCTLHRAGLKPLLCAMFPLTVAGGVLRLEDGARQPACCAPTPDGPLSVLDVCAAELSHALGPEGAAALRSAAT